MQKANASLARTGSNEAAGGNNIVILSGALHAWRVESGHVDVFAVRANGDAPISRRSFVRRFKKSALLFAGAPEDSAYTLIAVPAGRGRLRQVDVERLYERGRRLELSEDLSHAIDEWVEGISAGILAQVSPKQHAEPQLGRAVSVEAGTPLRSTRGLVWVNQNEGRACLVGREDLMIASRAGSSAPVGSRVWIVPVDSCRVHAAATVDQLRSGAVWRDLVGFHTLMLGAIEANENERRNRDHQRLERKRNASRTVLTNAVGHLANVMSEDQGAAVHDGDALVSACRVVGKACGIDVQVTVDTNGSESRGRLARIAAASRFRTRRVALRGAWWRHDAGPLLAVHRADKGDARVPVALVPNANGRYEMTDGLTGRTTIVDGTLDARLESFAYAFYRPFRDRAISAWEVFRFGAEGCRGDFSMILLMGLAGGILGLLPPIITGTIFNSVIPGAERVQLSHLFAALLICALANALFQLVRGYAVLRVESKMDAAVQSAVWDRLLNLPTTFFRKYAAGDLAVRASGISEIRRLLSGATVSSLLSGLFSMFNLGLLFYYDAGLALWACAMTLVALCVMISAGFAQLRFQRRVAKIQSRLSGQVLQYITGITKLRVAGAETNAYERWASEFANQRRLQFKARRVGNGLSTFNAVFAVLSMMVIFGVLASDRGVVMATGDFIAFNVAYGAFTTNLLAMTGAFIAVMLAVPIFEQAQPILEALPEVSESMSAPGALSGEIEISQVSFRYDPEGPRIINNISLRARPGEFIAFVGPSGSGKSTILRLLLGFEQPEHGSIYVDGRDLAGLDIQAVRRQVGVVLQNGSVMTGDLFTNITGSTLASMDDAWEAARMAGFDKDIQNMPMGMHTVVSEGGATLSGGQRQRLLIARAVVNRPRLLFFDEATSALDNQTQRIVSESLDRLQATRIVVAHRLSTIKNADRIYVLDNGNVVQEGTYAALLDEGGLFAKLIRRQMA